MHHNFINNKPHVSIIGCGWLGLPLAEKLVAEHYLVNGSTTSIEKIEVLGSKGIKPYLINLCNPESAKHLTKFLETDLIIINIPPGTKHTNGEAHVDQICRLLEAVNTSPILKLIYISSTSVYHNLNRHVTEKDVVNVSHASNIILARAEELILKNKNTTNVVLRCGGLAGGDRLLARHFAGKVGIPGGNMPVNLIHQYDVVAIICEVVKNASLKGTYNVCAPQHPLKKDLYRHDAKRYGLLPPQFDETPVAYKIIDSSKLEKALNYNFLFPDPADFPHTVLP